MIFWGYNNIAKFNTISRQRTIIINKYNKFIDDISTKGSNWNEQKINKKQHNFIRNLKPVLQFNICFFKLRHEENILKKADEDNFLPT